jgi:hypothetical protein
MLRFDAAATGTDQQCIAMAVRLRENKGRRLYGSINLRLLVTKSHSTGTQDRP